MTTTTLSNDALFVAAAWRGDLPAVKRHFTLPAVLANVAFWNNVNRRSRLRLPIELTRAPPLPWYYGTRHHDFSIDVSIVRRGHVEIFRWFLAREQLALLGETLRWVSRDILEACVVSADFWPACAMAEIFFESPLFQEEMHDDERSELLTVMLNKAAASGDARWVDVLLAFGADPNRAWHDETPLAVAKQDTRDAVDMLLAHGAWVESDTLLVQRDVDRDDGLVHDLLRYGANANVKTARHGSAPLHHAAQYSLCETMQLLVEEGFADVDARDVDGRTPLLVVASLNSNEPRRPDAPPANEMAQLLLDAGADVLAVDNQRRGVLHYTTRQTLGERSLECLHLYMERGANPNVQDANGETPMVALLIQAHDNVDPLVTEMLLRLVHAGGDPFIVDDTGCSAVRILEGSETGRAVLREHSDVFVRNNH